VKVPLRPLAVAAVLIESPRPEALAAFYRDLLGVPLLPQDLPGVAPHFACELAGVYLAISRGPRKSSGTCVAFMVEDVEASVRALAAAQVKFDAPARRTALGLIVRFEDPDGNPVELYQP
jgi:catechol 2,3-dioxygenase-like lactoylglutathione lyase family enzyme